MSNYYIREQDEEYSSKAYQRHSTRHQSNARPHKQCDHHLKVLQLQQKIKQLECAQSYLMHKNDEIIRGIQRQSEIARKQDEQSEAWRKKFQILKAENDRKAQKLAKKQAIMLQQRNLNKESSMSRGLKISMDGSRTGRKKQENLQEMLTKEEREYVRQLQETKRQRSSSVKLLSSSGGKKYSTMLPDGLVIHIIDNRKNCISRQ